MFSCFRHFFVVEFPDEMDSDGITTMAVISYNWVKYDDDKTLCIWPTYIKNNSIQRKMVLDHTIPDINRSEMCPINIKYRAGKY